VDDVTRILFGVVMEVLIIKLEMTRTDLLFAGIERARISRLAVQLLGYELGLKRGLTHLLFGFLELSLFKLFLSVLFIFI